MKAPLIISAVLGATLSLGLFDGPLGFVFAYQPSTQVRQSAPAVIAQDVDRSNKGDRLRPTAATRSVPTLTIVPKSNEPAGPATTPIRAQERLAPTTLKECEPLASPVADPALGKWAGRCFV